MPMRSRCARRIVAVLLAFCTLTALSGCRKKESAATEKNPTQQFEGAFGCQLKIESGDFTCGLQLQKNAEGRMSFTVSEPASLAGLSCEMTVSNVVFRMGGLEINPAGLQLKPAGVATILKNLFRAGDYTIKEKKGIITATGKDDQGDFSIAFDKKTLLPLSMTYGQKKDQQPVTITIESFTPQSGPQQGN